MFISIIMHRNKCTYMCFFMGLKMLRMDANKWFLLHPHPTPPTLNCSSRFQNKVCCFEDLVCHSWLLNLWFHLTLFWIAYHVLSSSYLTSFSTVSVLLKDTELHAVHDSGLTVESLQIRSMRNVCKTAKNRGQCENVMIDRALFSCWSHRP